MPEFIQIPLIILCGARQTLSMVRRDARLIPLCWFTSDVDYCDVAIQRVCLAFIFFSFIIIISHYRRIDDPIFSIDKISLRAYRDGELDH